MLCCSTFLGDFEPVSIKMAKDQNLSLNPSKISGLCGRLMCCLKYENDDYEEAKKLMPDIGARIETPEGPGRVVGLNLLERLLQVRLLDEEHVLEYTLEEIMDPANKMVHLIK
jgi:cell fate regulator YaaT (PSP1 superfamily)